VYSPIDCWQGPSRSRAIFTQAVLAVLFPPHCLGCGVRVVENGTVCPHCWEKLHFISRPFCPVMGTPFPYDAGENFFSVEALHNPPPFLAARSAVIHDGLSQALVTRLKYGSHTQLAPLMARWMVHSAQDLFAKEALIVPVPLHRFRFWRRGYNQSAELARNVAAIMQLPFHPEILTRKKHTRQQVGLNARARQDNVRSAFQVAASMKNLIQARPIILIDDVFTTGATVRAAAKTLLKAGAAHIYVITFSRALL